MRETNRVYRQETLLEEQAALLDYYMSGARIRYQDAVELMLLSWQGFIRRDRRRFWFPHSLIPVELADLISSMNGNKYTKYAKTTRAGIKAKEAYKVQNSPR